MRRLLLPLVLLSCLGASASAQTADTPPAAPDTRPPPMEVIDDSVQPQVTIKMRDGEMVEEHRINGKLYRVTVTPTQGEPYTLIDNSGDGTFTPLTTPGNPKLSVPMWVIGTF